MRRMEAISFGKASVTGALNINQTALLLAYIGILIEHHAGDVANEPLMRAVVVDLACSSPPPLPAIACPVAAQLASKSLTLRNAAYEKALQTHSSEAAAVLAKIAPQSVSRKEAERLLLSPDFLSALPSPDPLFSVSLFLLVLSWSWMSFISITTSNP